MQDFTVNGVSVHFDESITDASEDEAAGYVAVTKSRIENPDDLISLQVFKRDDGMVDIIYGVQGTKFERIRRITGYLVGSLDRWNDSKQAEERDRVKHANFDDYEEDF